MVGAVGCTYVLYMKVDSHIVYSAGTTIHTVLIRGIVLQAPRGQNVDLKIVQYYVIY